MIDPGPMLPERGKYRALYAEINRLKQCILALRPMPGVGTRRRATRIGTSVDATPGEPQLPSEGEKSTVPRWG